MNYSTKQKQLKKYIQRTQKKLSQKTFFSLTKRKQHQLVRKIQKLQTQLTKWIPEFKFSKLAASAAMILGLIGNNPLSAQADFGQLQNNPFNLSVVPGAIALTFGDVDNDGDFDLLSSVGDSYYYSGGIYFHENNGTPFAPDFAPPALITSDVITIIPNLSLVDIDNDGDLDLLSGLEPSMQLFNALQSVAYYENIGSDTVFTLGPKQVDPFNLSPIANSLFNTASPVDIDGDGDYDLCSMAAINYTPVSFSFSENIGDTAMANFAPFATDTSGLATSGPDEIGFPVFVDIDDDGDQDCFIGEPNGLSFLENIGSSTHPNFDTIQLEPFQLAFTGFVIPAFVDIDNDGDLDFFSRGDLSIFFQENHALGNPSTVLKIEDEGVDFQLFPNPVNDELNVQLQEETTVTLTIRNLYGQLVDEERSINSQLSVISTSNLPAGVYTLEVRSADKSSTKKFVKQ